MLCFPRRCCSPDDAQDTIDELHGKGKWVSCCISVGTVESWRDDAGDFPPSVVGEAKSNVENERFLDIAQDVCTIDMSYVHAI